MPATSIKQQQAMGIARGIQKGEIKPKKGTTSAKIAKTMKPGDVKDFASTEHEGLPKKAKKESIDGAIDTLYMVKKPYSGCQLTDLVEPIDPLVGLGGSEIVPDHVHSVFPDQDQAQAIAETLYEEYCSKMEALEEKKGAVTGKISTAIDTLEKKRKEHVDMAKADPKNAGQHKEHIAKLAMKIDDLMSKLEKVEKSKKAIEDKKEKKSIKENEEPKAATSTTGLAKMFRQLAQNLPTTKGMSSKEIEGIEKLINTILSKASAGEIALAIGKAQMALDNSTKNLGGKPAMPTVPAKKSSDNKYAAPAMPAVPKKSGNFSLNNDR